MLRQSLIVSVALLLAAFVMIGSAQADGTPTPDAMPGDRVDANGAAVKITSPQDGAVLDVPTVIVRVETTNWPLGEAGHHFHLYVNGQVQGMSQGNSPAIQARDLQPGENILEVVLSNEQHQELNATNKISVRYETSASAPLPPTRPLSGPLPSNVIIGMVGLAVAAAVALGIGLALQRRKLR